MKLLGEVRGKTVFMADDMIGTGGTLIKGMKTLRELGAQRVICAVSLPLFSGSAIEDFEAAYRLGYFYRIIGTNAVHHRDLLQKEWYIQADVTGLFAQIISLVHHNRSVSSMLDNRELVAKRIKKQLERVAREGSANLAAHGSAMVHQRSSIDHSESAASGTVEEEPLPHGAARET
jgi:ribose-phosphate pyrophosphokinase